MRNIKHIFDSELDSKLVSSLPYDGDDMIYNKWNNELYRFVKPIDTNQTFGSWKVNMPTYTFKKHGNILSSVLMSSLNDSYSLFDQTDIFGTDLSSKFMLQTNVHWQKKIGGGSNDYGYAIAVDSVGNVYLNGNQESDSYGSNDYGVIKLDSLGNEVWQKKIGGGSNDYGRAIAVDSSGNVYLNGYQESDSYGIRDYGVIKLDSSGNILWQKKIGEGGNDYGYAIDVDSSGNVYLTGYQESDSYGGRDYGVIKLDSSGNEVWQKKIGGGNSDIGYSIAVDDSGNIYLNGYQESDSYGSYDYGVIKLDSNGNILWQKKIGGGSNDYGEGIAVDSVGNVYLNGYQGSDIYGGTYDYGVIKLDTDQESDMNLSIGDMTLSIGDMSLSIGAMNLSIGDMTLSIGDMSLSIGDMDISGTVVDGLNYIG